MSFSLAIGDLLEAYRARSCSPREVLEDVLERIDAAPDHSAWITRLSPDHVMRFVDALPSDPMGLPLYGIPFAVKDNIDLAGVPTSAACPEFAYVPARSARVVDKLIQAGAIPLGKTNLDQFATGLVGTRSPHGAGRNSFNAEYISGGSSSGSALAVAMGHVSFALGTDTAGSGRVPAAFNNLIGLKPSRGLLSTQGVVPACRTLDCVSIFSLTIADARGILRVAEGYDAGDPFSREVDRRAFVSETFRFGVPRADQLRFFGDTDYARLWERSIEHLEALGGRRKIVDFEPFLAAARLLYEGPWVAERYAAIDEFIRMRPEAILPITRSIIEAATRRTAVEAFQAQYRLAALRDDADVWNDIDVLVTPTAGTIYSIAEVEANPLELNSNLGYYTNFVNLLDLAAVAVPAGFRSDGLPFGITLIAPSGSDEALLRLADRAHGVDVSNCGAHQALSEHAAHLPVDVAPGFTALVVCGAHMEGLPLNHQLTSRGAYFVRRTRTASEYRLYALPGGPPARPGMVHVTSGGASIDAEVWAVPTKQLGSFLSGIPSPLGLGKVRLADGAMETGFTCEQCAVEGATDITHLGGWRAFLASRNI